MTTLDRDGEYFVISLDAGLSGVSLRLTRNEFISLWEQGRVLLYPPPLAESGPDEETNAS